MTRDISKIEAYYARSEMPKTKPFKILHIGNTAGVAGFIAQAMDRRYNTESRVIARTALDPFNCIVKGENYKEGPRRFIIRALGLIPFYDIIHVHSIDKVIPLIKLAIPWKPLFLHYHGTEIRGLWEEKTDRWKWADEIFVSTPDLCAGAPARVKWIPNVVNEELLDVIRYHADPDKFKVNTALSVSLGARKEAAIWAKTYAYKIEFANRELEGEDHAAFLEGLINYSAYVDVKREPLGGAILEAHSLTGLEALYLGRPVIRWDGELIEDFPPEHNAQFVAKKLIEIYRRYIA